MSCLVVVCLWLCVCLYICSPLYVFRLLSLVLNRLNKVANIGRVVNVCAQRFPLVVCPAFDPHTVRVSSFGGVSLAGCSLRARYELARRYRVAQLRDPSSDAQTSVQVAVETLFSSVCAKLRELLRIEHDGGRSMVPPVAELLEMTLEQVLEQLEKPAQARFGFPLWSQRRATLHRLPPLSEAGN